VGEDTGDVFALAQVTPDQQTSARTWLGEHWNGGVRSVMGTKHGNVMPAFNSTAWWKFVRMLLRRVFGFGLRAPDATGLRAIVANSFWGDHNVDVGAVIRQHREQTRVARGEPEKAVTSHQGRAFGQLPVRVRHCDLCPPGSPAVDCVRQFGTQWLCMELPPGAAPLASCHRNYQVCGPPLRQVCLLLRQIWLPLCLVPLPIASGVALLASGEAPLV
jgi:hypothetical protein